MENPETVAKIPAALASALSLPDAAETEAYNCVDCQVTARVAARMQGEGGAASAFDQALLGVALTAQLRGLRIDHGRLLSAREEVAEEIKRVRAVFEKAAGNWKWGRGAKPSSKQLQDLLYNRHKVRVRLGNTDSPSVAKDALISIQEDPKTPEEAIPVIEAALDLSRLEEDRKALEHPTGPDGRLHCSFLVAAQVSGRWCLPGWCEVLTKEGWISLKDWNPEDKIMVWSPERKRCFWSSSKKAEFANSENLISMRGGQKHKFKLVCTREHRIPTYNRHGDLVVKPAGQAGEFRKIPLGGEFLDERFAPELQTRIAVMTHADGCMVMRGVIRFKFVKERKIERCKALLDAAGIGYEVKTPPSGATSIYVKAAPGWMKLSKWFGPWLLKHNPRVFVEEVGYWDGQRKKRPRGEVYTIYFTTDKEAAEWVATMAHLAGRSASIHEKRRQEEKWHDNYNVYISRGTEDVNCFGKNKSEYAEPIDRVYCAETETGFFLTRCLGSISVTGNSARKDCFGDGIALYGASDPIRKLVVPDPGYILVSIDQRQAESRMVAYLSGSQWYIDAHETAQNVHIESGRVFFPEYAETLTKAWAQETPFPHNPGHTYYALCKRLQHANNYMQTHKGIARHLHIPESAARSVQANYFRRAPEIKLYHDWVANELKTKRRLVSPMGRVRQFLGRVWESSTIREAVSWQPQSCISDLTKAFMWKLWKYLDPNHLQILLEHHDSVLFQVKEESLDSVMLRVIEFSRIEIPIGGRTMQVSWEVKIGSSWFDLKEIGKDKELLWGLS